MVGVIDSNKKVLSCVVIHSVVGVILGQLDRAQLLRGPEA
jgi:hypothetical protein